MLARLQDGFHTFLRLRREEESAIDVTCFFEELALPVGMVESTVPSRVRKLVDHFQVVDMQSAIIPGYPAYGIHANHTVSDTFLRAWPSADSPGHDHIRQ